MSVRGRFGDRLPLDAQRGYWVRWVGVEPAEMRSCLLILPFDPAHQLAGQRVLIDDVAISPFPVPQRLGKSFYARAESYSAATERAKGLSRPGEQPYMPFDPSTHLIAGRPGVTTRAGPAN